LRADIISLKSLPLFVVSTAGLMQKATEIALDYPLYAYDSCYVALSYIVNAPLLTLDKKLVNALVTGSYSVHLFSDFNLP
jgi:predicted nucleic acid-binding protein